MYQSSSSEGTSSGGALVPVASETESPRPVETLTHAHRPLGGDLIAELWRAGRGSKAGVLALCDAAFAVLVGRHLGEAEVTFFHHVNAADAVGDSDGDAIGKTASPEPQRRRVSLHDDMSVSDFVTVVRQQVQGHRPARLAKSHQPDLATAAARRDETFAIAFREVVLRVETSAGDHDVPAEPEDASLSGCVVIDLVHGGLAFRHPGSGICQAAADRILASLEHLLLVFATHEARLLGDIEVLPKPERHRLLETWNETDGAPCPEETLHAGFERQVAERPDAVAWESDGQSFTFKELDRRAHQLAEALRARGVGRGQCVGVCTERGVSLVVALLGVLKAGAAYLPLDPTCPRDRLTAMLHIAGASWAVTEAHLQHLLGVRSIILQHGSIRSAGESPVESPKLERPGARPGAKPEASSAAADPCYVMFTSDGAGEPKGVLMSHRAVMNTLAWVTRRCAVGPRDRALFVTSPSVDISVYDLFGVLGTGGTLVMASPAVLEDPAALAQALGQRRITLWSSPPALFEKILPFVPSEGAPTLRWVLLSGLSGDGIPVNLPAQMNASFPGAQLLALAGTPEVALWSNALCVSAVDPTWKSIPHGRPLANVRCHVLDHRRHPVPVGVSGELYLGGAGLAEGYVNRPGLTAEHFVWDPFRPRQRLYRTGHRARYLEDGNIELLGPLSRQSKRDGQLDTRSLPHPRQQMLTTDSTRSTRSTLRALAPRNARELPMGLPVSLAGSSGPPRRAPHLFALQEGGSRPPLVFVAGELAIPYRELSQLWGPDQPVYAFLPGSAELSQPSPLALLAPLAQAAQPIEARGVEELAALYETELAALHGDRPYVLGGFGFGALPAFELACRLQKRGRRVPLVISLDGVAPGLPKKRPLASRLVDQVSRFSQRDTAARREDAQTRAAQSYLPKSSFQGSLLLLRVEQAEQWPGRDSDPLYGWERHVTGPVTLSTIPAKHSELLANPAHQKASAAIIARHIDAVVVAERRGSRTYETVPSLHSPAFSAWTSVNSGREV